MRLIPAIALATLLPASLMAGDGAAVFKASCASCHGQDAKGQTPVGKSLKIKDLHTAEVQKESAADLAKVISDGKGKMPAFKSKLTKAQIDDVVAYIKSLK
jgi:cytochrome c6